ncbi:hypothetical protein CFC21_088696 [Triticum aestivum]|uniref:Uncharacterized protein n=3 Tax=Triticum TaxID=4564 RepID=A0A9R0YQR8_TRITD|nr:histone-lysine N-methyltransferase, H3 lysine-9 specific-like [Triticum dicoccoides]XP_044409536.1 histone-lysine N-methyltransferase, H3 lysine-9 specific-like [Triticum aestivum]KAF7085231.1 hypothetical protein CFC21_088696 [Triticum aestivum]VAI59133.1 unnamed protein product [Triticum turgidum subsp. durum]
MAGSAAQAPTQTGRTRPIPTALVPAAVVLAVVVGVLSLLPSVAQAVWELPHLFLLGLVISYGVFAQHKNGAAAGDGGDAAKDGARAWNSRYHPDDPLVVVAPDHAAADDGDDGAGGRPFSLPVRRLKTVVEEPTEAGGASGESVGEETDSSESTAGFWAGAPAAPSPPSVLDAFDSRKFNAATPPSVVQKEFPGYDSGSPRDQSSCNEEEEEEEVEEEEEEEGTDWEEDADGSDEMTAASSERSFPGDFVACRNRRYDGSGDGESMDEELVELATRPGPEGADEVDRKADEFIAKFREQIRRQRL